MKRFYFIFLFFASSLGFAQEQQSGGNIEGLKIYPNPVTDGKIFISTSLNAQKKVVIFDVLGTQILKTTLLGSELHLYNVAPGIYVLRIFERDKISTRKLVVK